MQQRFEHGGNIYQENPAQTPWLDFSANINPLGLSPNVKQAIELHIDDVIHYPDPQGTRLKQALQAQYQIPYESILLGNGAAELFYVYMHAFRPKRVVLPVPSFSEYEKAARSCQADVSYILLREADGFAMDWDALYRACDDADCIILGNPNNPTGNLLSADDLTALARRAEATRTDIIVDESFLDFRDDEEKYTIRSLPAQYDHVFVIRSLTKFYALPGLRLGFAVVPPAKLAAMEAQKDVWNTNVLAQWAGIAALQDRGYQQQTRDYVRTARQWLYTHLNTLPGCTAFLPSVNFILAKIETENVTMRHLIFALRQHGILVRECSNYPGLTASFLRFAVKTSSNNEILYRTLKKIMHDK